jgi:hypothetical protein
MRRKLLERGVANSSSDTEVIIQMLAGLYRVLNSANRLGTV